MSYYKLFPEDDESGSADDIKLGIDLLRKGDLIGSLNYLFPKLNLIPSIEDKRKPILDSNFSFFCQTPIELGRLYKLRKKYLNYIQNPSLSESSFEKEKADLISSIELFLNRKESIKKSEKIINNEQIDSTLSKKMNLQNQNDIFPMLKSRNIFKKLDIKSQKSNAHEKKAQSETELNNIAKDSTFKENYMGIQSMLETNSNRYLYSSVLKNSLKPIRSSARMNIKSEELIFTRTDLVQNDKMKNKQIERKSETNGNDNKKFSQQKSNTKCDYLGMEEIIKHDIENILENNKFGYELSKDTNRDYNKHFIEKLSSSNYLKSENYNSIDKSQSYQLNFKKKLLLDFECLGQSVLNTEQKPKEIIQLNKFDSCNYDNQQGTVYSVLKNNSSCTQDELYKNHISNRNENRSLFEDIGRAITVSELEQQAIEQYKNSDENENFDDLEKEAEAQYLDSK